MNGITETLFVCLMFLPLLWLMHHNSMRLKKQIQTQEEMLELVQRIRKTLEEKLEV